MVQEWQTLSPKKLKQSLLDYGGAVLTDGVSLRIQGRYFLGLPLHHIDIVKGNIALEETRIHIKESAILFVEGPVVASGSYLQALINDRLRLLNGFEFHSIQKTFTVVTDGAASKEEYPIAQ